MLVKGFFTIHSEFLLFMHISAAYTTNSILLVYLVENVSVEMYFLSLHYILNLRTVHFKVSNSLSASLIDFNIIFTYSLTVGSKENSKNKPSFIKIKKWKYAFTNLQTCNLSLTGSLTVYYCKNCHYSFDYHFI